MTTVITEQELQVAYAEIEELKRKREAARSIWTENLYNFVTEVMKDAQSRSGRKMTWDELAAFLRKKEWCTINTGDALSQSFRREKERRTGI